MSKRFKRVMVTGGAGYVGSNLVPKLLAAGYQAAVLDLYIYGDVFSNLASNPNLTEVKGDLRNPADVQRALAGCDAVIHLACISNDPSFDLNPDLGRSINYDCFRPLVKASKDAGVKRFIYASSSSVYGIKSDSNVTEDLPLEPLTDYSKYKAMCEEVLDQEREPGFVAVTLRPATVCGYAPRLRLDLTVNILTSHAINNGRITVFGGEQLRPNLHVEDMLHPGKPLALAQSRHFRRSAVDLYGADPSFATRLGAHLPLFGLRWVLILLNEFIPERWQRRVLAGARRDWGDAKAAQLALASEFLAALPAKVKDA